MLQEVLGKGLHDAWRLVDGLRLPAQRRLADLQRVLADEGGVTLHLQAGMGTIVDHELEHETAHFTTLAVLSGVVVEDGDVVGTL